LYIHQVRLGEEKEEMGKNGLEENFLQTLFQKEGLIEYIDVFLKNDIDQNTFCELKEHHLLEMGITKIGPKLKILQLVENFKGESNGNNGNNGNKEIIGTLSPKNNQNFDLDIRKIPNHFGDIM